MTKRHQWLRWLARVDKAIEAFEKAVLAWSIIAMATVSVANVAGRNLFGYSLAFAEELNQILIILITFLGIGYGARHARHIRMSALYDQLQGRTRKALMVIITTGTGVLMFVLAWYAGRYVAGVAAAGSVTPALRIPLYVVYAWVPVGFAIAGLQYLLAAVRNLTAEGVHLSYQQAETYEEGGL